MVYDENAMDVDLLGDGEEDEGGDGGGEKNVNGKKKVCASRRLGANGVLLSCRHVQARGCREAKES